ncbi:hypothetical protein LCGC14_1687460 [marine sediment metagenome]|uniref:Uncharacterized protein n=1 Tax=marine sediment metagenome TaxID=412755 RepID=A0A0F9K2D8_9ZZZZ
MALQKDYDIKGIMATEAYHKIKQLIIGENNVVIVVGVYKDVTNAADIINEINERRYLVKDIESGDQNYTDYFATVHATDNAMTRAETYLVDKEADYVGATTV